MPKHQAAVEAYVDGILSGSIIANKERVLACRRFRDDLRSGKWDFKPRDAEFVISIIESTFVHIKGPKKGQPLLLEPWEQFIVYNLVGFYLKGTSERRFKEAFIFIPRKNGKTTFIAALAWALSLLERQYASTIYIVGNVLKQALESFDIIRRNINIMGEAGNFRILDNNSEHSISREFRTQGGDEAGSLKIEALASNPDNQDGYNCNIAICDEVHAYKDPNQYFVIRQAMKAYVNKLLIGITTAGKNMNSFCYSRLEYCKKILVGTETDDQYFVFICQADDAEDYCNPAEHEKANPNYRVTIRPEDLMQEAQQAQNDPVSRLQFLNKSLNIYVNDTKSYFNVFEVQESDRQYNWTLEELARLSIQWFGGADLSKVSDLSAGALHGSYKGVDISITHGFIPVVTAQQKASEDNIPLFGWKDEGWLTLCNGEVIDYDDVVKWFIAMRDIGFKPKWVGYDRRFSREFVMKMKKAGFRMRDQSQRYVEKTEAFRHVESRIKQKQFYYLHNKAFEYCISNVHAIEDSDDFVRFQKIQPTQRIDLFDADVIAAKQMLIDRERSSSAKSWLE